MRAADKNTPDEYYNIHNLEENVHSLFEEFTLVERLARVVASIQGMSPDYTHLASELSHILPFDVLGIVLLRHDRKAVRVTICSRDEGLSHAVQWQVHHRQHPLMDSMFERISTHSSLLVQAYPDGLDGLPAQCGDALSSYHQLRATCIVPLRTEERIFGTLELGSTINGSYSDLETQRLVNAIAQMLATAIERVQLGGNTQIQDRQRQALKHVSTALTAKLNVSDVLEHIATGISTALHVSSLLVTLNSSRQQLQLMAYAGFNEAELTAFAHEEYILDEKSIIGCAIHHRQPFLSDDIATDERFPLSHHFYAHFHMHSVLCYPLIADTVVYGALLLCAPHADSFTPLKVDIVALFADQAAIAIREGMLQEATSQRHHFQEVIEQLEREAHEPLSIEEELRLFTQVRKEVRHTFGVSLSSLLKLVGNNLLTRNERATYLIMKESQEPQDVLGQVGTVLARADVLSELSRLLVQQEQTPHGVRDAWFVSELTNTCIYLNPLAESLCNVRLSDIEQSRTSLEDIFAWLFPRIRNAEEVRHYLQAFVETDLRNSVIRCIVAQERFSLRSSVEQRLQEEEISTNNKIEEDREDRENRESKAARDNYYQLTRHPMYNQRGQLIAYALQVSDITTYVLDESNKAALLSSVSHHLRTPLTTIKAAVTGLLQKDIPWSEEMRREMLEDIDVESDHLTVLINGLVEMSRIEMGALLLDKTWCNIEEIVYGAIHKASHMLTDRPVEVQMLKSSPLVYVDYVQIERVMSNLLENAALHSFEHTTIDVVVKEVGESVEGVEDAQPAQIHIQVIYNGESIPRQEREHLFRSFDTFHSSGNGLSLAICKGIIEAHQGRIWIGDVESGGSSFEYTLPVYALQTVRQR